MVLTSEMLTIANQAVLVTVCVLLCCSRDSRHQYTGYPEGVISLHREQTDGSKKNKNNSLLLLPAVQEVQLGE